MKYEFKQVNLGKALLLLIFVITVFVFVPILIIGFDKSADYVNSIGSKIGFIVGIAVILPALYLKKYIGDKIEISINNGFLQIKKNENILKETNIKNIDSLVYSDLSTKILDIYLKDKTKFYQIKPNSLNVTKQIEDVNMIINIFESELEFELVVETKKSIGQDYNQSTYKVKNIKKFN